MSSGGTQFASSSYNLPRTYSHISAKQSQRVNKRFAAPSHQHPYSTAASLPNVKEELSDSQKHKLYCAQTQ